MIKPYYEEENITIYHLTLALIRDSLSLLQCMEVNYGYKSKRKSEKVSGKKTG